MDCDSERIWKMVEKYTLRDKAQRRPDSLNIYDNLYNCYIDNYQTCPDKRFRTGVNLLQKLPPELAVVSLVIKLYGDEDGYSVALGPNDQKEVFFPYEDNEIFFYLDAGEIPPVLLEVIENTNFCHFYNGCLVCEVRNYRIPQPLEEQLGDNADSNAEFESIHVLLKASQETILRYVSEVCSDRHCSAEERLSIESKLLLATQQPLCLEPEIDVVCVQNRLHYNRRKYNKLSFKRYVRKYSHARRARLEMALGGKGPLSLKLIQFIQDRRRSGAAVPKPPLVLSFGRKKGLMKVPCALDELLQEVTKHSKSYQSDVQSLIQLRNEAAIASAMQQNNAVSSSATQPVQPPITTTSISSIPAPPPAVPLKGVKPLKEPPQSPLHLPSVTSLTSHPKPTDTTVIAPQPQQYSTVNPSLPLSTSISNSSTSTTSGPLTVSLPRSLASVHAVGKSESKKNTSSRTKKPRPSVARPNVLPRPPLGTMPRPPPGPMPRPPPGSMPLPGKTTVTVLSKSVGGPRMVTPPIPNLLPKLHNPTIGMKTALPPSQPVMPTGSMPRLKPLEAHKVTPPPAITLNKPPPLAPRPNSPAVPPPTSIKQPPTATSASLMPQLHKIQLPSSSSDKPNTSS